MRIAIIDENSGAVVTVTELPEIHGYEPGVGLIAVDATGEEAFAGCTWSEGGGFVPPPPPAHDPAAAYAALAAYSAQKRWEAEIAGISVGGIPVFTDDRSKLMVMGARIRAAADPNVIEKWAAADGNVYDLDAATIIAISDAIAAHVSACFAKFAEVKAAIAAETITDYAGIDAAFAQIGQ